MLRVWVRILVWWICFYFISFFVFCNQICVSFCNIFTYSEKNQGNVTLWMMHRQLWLMITRTASRVMTATLLSIHTASHVYSISLSSYITPVSTVKPQKTAKKIRSWGGGIVPIQQKTLSNTQKTTNYFLCIRTVSKTTLLPIMNVARSSKTSQKMNTLKYKLTTVQ